MKLSSETIQKMIHAVRATRDIEIDCGHCHEELDRFIEMKLNGKNAAEAMPLVQAHLDSCLACREEYEVLLEALQALAEQDLG
jgi:predicted anti-sigma-YlaC factor YlaD